MTLFMTHLSLGAIILWSFISTSEKKNFSENKWIFWLIILFSIFPDLDIFFGMHRGISHSVVFPILIAITGTILYYYFNYCRNEASNNNLSINEESKLINSINKSFYGRCIVYTSITWLIHIVLDLEYPIAIFYPLSDRLYQINFVYTLDLMPWLIFPAMIIGIGFKITDYTFLQGISTYFINLSPSTREEIFGGTIANFAIENFFIHTFLFAFFVVYVAKPMLPIFEIKKLKIWRQQLQFDGIILCLGIILILTGLFLGPMIGNNYIDQQSISSSFTLSQNSFSPMIALTFEPTHFIFQPNPDIKIEGKLTIHSVNDSFDQILLLITHDSYDDLTIELYDLFNQYPPNSSENLVVFESHYKTILQNIRSQSLAINESNHHEIIIKEKLISNSYALVGIIKNWNSSLILDGTHLSENIRLEAIIITNRFFNLILGMISIIIGIILSFISLFVAKRQIMKRL